MTPLKRTEKSTLDSSLEKKEKRKKGKKRMKNLERGKERFADGREKSTLFPPKKETGASCMMKSD